ncbi:MAG: hypothetical protein HC932_02880 [Thermales bacterium]|nr:hypothetical protein [Thermales bacterium]
MSGFTPVNEYNINTINKEYGTLKNSKEKIEDTTKATIKNEGGQYDVIQTTNKQVTFSKSPQVTKTTYEQSHFFEETHLTFEILMLKKNAEKNNWENIIGAEDSYILPNGKLNPNYPLTPEQRNQQFQALQNGLVVNQAKVDEILEPGESTREDLQGVSRNFSVLVNSQENEDLGKRNLTIQSKKFKQ